MNILLFPVRNNIGLPFITDYLSDLAEANILPLPLVLLKHFEL